MKEDTKTETKTEEEFVTHRGKFRCKKCNKYVDNVHMRTMTVMQKNKPLDFEHIMFPSKADVKICNVCFKEMQRG